MRNINPTLPGTLILPYQELYSYPTWNFNPTLSGTLILTYVEH